MLDLYPCVQSEKGKERQRKVFEVEHVFVRFFIIREMDFRLRGKSGSVNGPASFHGPALFHGPAPFLDPASFHKPFPSLDPAPFHDSACNVNCCRSSYTRMTGYQRGQGSCNVNCCLSSYTKVTRYKRGQGSCTVNSCHFSYTRVTRYRRGRAPALLTVITLAVPQ